MLEWLFGRQQNPLLIQLSDVSPNDAESVFWLNCDGSDDSNAIAGSLLVSSPQQRKHWSTITITVTQRIHFPALDISVDLASRELSIPCPESFDNSDDGTKLISFEIPLSCKYIHMAKVNDHEIAPSSRIGLIDRIYHDEFTEESRQNKASFLVGQTTISPNDLCGRGCSCCVPWLNSYHGDYFSITHQLQAHVSYGWLSLSHAAAVPLHLMKYCPKIYNNQASLLSVELASERVQSSDIVVAVGTAKGYCYLSLGSPIIDLRRAADEGHGVAMILNTEGLRGSLFRAYVTIIRAEYVADMCAETILAVHHVLGPECPEMLELAAKDKSVVYSQHNGETSPDDVRITHLTFPLSKAGTEIALCSSFDTSPFGLPESRVDMEESCTYRWKLERNDQLTPESVDLYPKTPDSNIADQSNQDVTTVRKDVEANGDISETNIEEEDEDRKETMRDSLACRHYLRLVVEETNSLESSQSKVIFNTTELFFYSSQPSERLSRIRSPIEPVAKELDVSPRTRNDGFSLV